MDEKELASSEAARPPKVMPTFASVAEVKLSRTMANTTSAFVSRMRLPRTF